MIPKTIHYCWLSGEPYPALTVRCIETWRKHLSGYKLVLWDRAKAGSVMSVPWVKEAYENRKYAFAADYIRLYALHTEGGIYLDADVEVLKDFSPLLHQPSFMGYEVSGDLEPAVIGAQAGAAWVEKCLAYYSGRHFCTPDGALDMRPLPGVVEGILKTTYAIPVAVAQPLAIEAAGLTLYPASWFSPKNAHTGKIRLTENTHAIHHFDSRWVKRNLRYHAKRLLHRAIILAAGQRMHNAIVEKIRDEYKKH
jgi:hypothetical protein